MQSGLHRVTITTLNDRLVHLSEECDGLWDTPGEIADELACVDFSDFMEQ
jgi:hypothetical protein